MSTEPRDRGQAALGEPMLLGCQCRNASGSPTAPDACPTMKVYSQSGTLVLTMQIPVQDKFGRNGLFAFELLLNELFAVGRYVVTYDWTTGGGAYTGGCEDTFEVLGGGDVDGQMISLFHFQRPHGTHVVGQTDNGKIVMGRNPHV